ncbi:MAG TPA: histidine phosphatase family protein [Dongiaceae bacterium]|jgi:broad specificity phosphatase PhoE|nr:histidine phosphatase family protein [Dongiaceae bacterium]
MTLRITWLAHGATSATRRVSFPEDESLEEKAREAAARLRDSIPRADRVLIAPERRTRETAGTLGLSGTSDPLLRDCDHGRWAGRTLAELQAQEPRALAAWLEDPDTAPHGGESVADVIRRIARWSDSLERGEGRILAITHPTILRAALIHAMGAPVSSFWRVDVAPLSRLTLSRQGAHWRVQALLSP